MLRVHLHIHGPQFSSLAVCNWGFRKLKKKKTCVWRPMKRYSVPPMMNLGNLATRSERFEKCESRAGRLPYVPSRMLPITFCKNSDAISPGSATANISLLQLLISKIRKIKVKSDITFDSQIIFVTKCWSSFSDTKRPLYTKD